MAEAIAGNIALLFDEGNKPFLKPWDLYPKLFEDEKKAYEKAVDKRQQTEYSEQRREYIREFNRRRHE